MDKDYYNEALQWYNSIYISCAKDRNIFTCIFIVIAICLFQMYSVVKVFYAKQDTVKQYVIYTNHDKKLSLTMKQFDIGDGLDNFLYNFLIVKYIENMENLSFDKNNKSAMYVLQKKANIIKNTSNNTVYQKYIDGVYKDDYGDLSMYLANKQKLVEIENIEFVSAQSMLTNKVYSIVNKPQPNIANVVFVVKIFSNQSEIKKRYKAQVAFSLNRAKMVEKNQTIDFRVYDYSKVEIKEE